MIKRTLYFGNPTYLRLNMGQLCIHQPDETNKHESTHGFKDKPVRTIPIEDIGVIVLDHQQITITHGVIDLLLDNNVALITCTSNHLPNGLMLPMVGNTLQTKRFLQQIEVSLPLKKQLWQQTIASKIRNQASVLHRHRGVIVKNMFVWANDVKSNDNTNLEARAAAYYWANILPQLSDFTRGDETPPNNLFNYGYAILRAIVARALISTGLMPTLGIHHRNKYNAYCLADDIMEPYRPYVDQLVIEIIDSGIDYSELTLAIKAKLLSIPVIDVTINGSKSPLMIAVSQTTISLYRCYIGELRKIAYPEII